jgi:hypothetical protein
MHVGFWWGGHNERDHYENLNLGVGDNIKIDFKEIRWGDMDWLGLAQDRYQWRALVNMVMNSWVPYNDGKFLSG